MTNKSLKDYSKEDLPKLMDENVDAIVMVDTTNNTYRSIVRKGFFKDFIDEYGDYHQLIEKLWFHLDSPNEEITADYKAFVSYYGIYKGKHSKRLRILTEESETPHILQMTVYPMKGTDKYIFVMDELDDHEYTEEFMTSKKVNTIQNTYLFSMYVDLIRDTTNSISVTEISDETVNASIKYSEWRLMTVNMIWPEDQQQFLKMTDPETLKKSLTPGRTMSMDCKMKNLEGVYIWVKLIFSRAAGGDDDFRFVFMVQDIDDSFTELMSTLKKYEERAVKDSLTGLLNRGTLETEIQNSIDVYKKGGSPVTLMMLDLDHFKNINDTYGHSMGDATLKAFANVLKSCVAGQNASVGRWGGEEFVVVLNDVSGDEAISSAESIRKKVEKADFGQVGHITCSIGVSQLTEKDTFDDLFDRMDSAMYSSKESGRNKVTLK